MTGVKKNFLKLTLDKSHFITEKKEDYYGNDLCVVRDKSYIFG